MFAIMDTASPIAPAKLQHHTCNIFFLYVYILTVGFFISSYGLLSRERVQVGEGKKPRACTSKGDVLTEPIPDFSN